MKYKKVRISKTKTIDEHRLLMEKQIGRKLLFNEIVHHKNKDKSDNSLYNLEIKERGLHTREHQLMGDIHKWTHEDSKKGGRATRIKYGKRVMISDKGGNDIMIVASAVVAGNITRISASLVRSIVKGKRRALGLFNYRFAE